MCSHAKRVLKKPIPYGLHLSTSLDQPDSAIERSFCMSAIPEPSSRIVKQARPFSTDVVNDMVVALAREAF